MSDEEVTVSQWADMTTGGLSRLKFTGGATIEGFDADGKCVLFIYDEGGHSEGQAKLIVDTFNECTDLRARLAAAESRLREYEDAPVVAHLVGSNFGIPDNHIVELIIRPRGGKGE